MTLVPSAKFAGTEEIALEQGIVIGKQELSENGRSYLSFRGIPYAAPPIDDLRFRVITFSSMGQLLINYYYYLQLP